MVYGFAFGGELFFFLLFFSRGVASAGLRARVDFFYGVDGTSVGTGKQAHTPYGNTENFPPPLL